MRVIIIFIRMKLKVCYRYLMSEYFFCVYLCKK